MDNNQFNNPYNNQYNNQYNNYGQQPMYNQPMNYNQQPMYGQPVYNQQQFVQGQYKKNNTGLIVGIVIAVIVIIGVVYSLKNTGKKIDGKWVCTGSRGTLIIDADNSAKKVNMQLGTYTVEAEYRVSGTVNPKNKKDGYKYTQYAFTNGKNSSGVTYTRESNVGFVFGIDSNDETKGHYISSVKETGVEFTCTKSN